MSQPSGPFSALYEDLKAGRVSRRDFMSKAIALGVGAPVAAFVLNNAPNALAQDATPATGAPASGTEGQTRGAGGELKMLQWQAPTHFGTHTSQGTKDQLAASLIFEPLISTLADGTKIPALAAEVPSVENGGLAEDLSSVTYKLKEGVLWSDGTPFTANDVVATWQWVTDTANNAVFQTLYTVISAAEAVDDLTVKFTFSTPQLAWYIPFSGSYTGVVYPKHILDQGPDAYAQFVLNPVGTGPYTVQSFSVGDQVIYAANENYREPNKPFFATVNLKGGGDATSAAQAVLETGDWDFAWNLQVESTILRDLEANGKGSVQITSPTSVERININFSDPNTEVNGQRSEINTPHPFLTDKAVRQALALATDRDTVANQFYLGGELEKGARNILTGIGSLESPNTSYEFNVDKANETLEAAGWVKDGDVRKKGDVELKISYVTTINPVRQKTQAVNKQNWEAAGFKVSLKQVDSTIFFDSSAGNDQNAAHFYTDLSMFTDGATSDLPTNYMASWYSGTPTSVAQKENNWLGSNYSRWVSQTYNDNFDRLQATTSVEEATAIFIALNDELINEVVLVPVVARASEVYAISNTLNNDNVGGSMFEALYWNIANWNRVS
jgi:peptide/nickel transport system substrate-binding protein